MGRAVGCVWYCGLLGRTAYCLPAGLSSVIRELHLLAGWLQQVGAYLVGPNCPFSQLSNPALPPPADPLAGQQTEPERLRQELEEYLTQLEVPHSYSTTTKFANFRNRTLE